MPRLVACGIPRSGSTLIWQLLQAIFPLQEIQKVHPDVWKPEGATAVISIRDPRDVVASLYRIRLARRHRRGKGAARDLTAAIQRMEVSFRALREVVKGPSLLLWYEDFWNNYGVIFDALEEEFSVAIPADYRRMLSGEFGVSRNRERASKLEDFGEWDEFHIHGDHIGSVRPGAWAYDLPEWARARVEEACCGVGEEWGYGSRRLTP